MRRASLALLAGLLALPAAAEPVETALLPHASGQARLVLSHWPAAGWVLSQQGRRVEIRFPGEALDIELAGIRTLGGEWPSRLAGAESAVGPEGTLLALALACDCGVALSGDGEARLAIDIVGAGLPPGPRLRARGPAPARAPLPPVRGGGSPGQEDLRPDIAEARARLLAQLERAAAAGLVTLKPEAGAEPSGALQGAEPPPAETPGPLADTVDAPAAAPTAGREAGARAAPAPEPAAPEARPAAAAGRRPAGARGDAAPEPASVAAARPETADCHPDAAFTLPDPQDEPFAAALATRRAALLGEFDRPDPAAVADLARLYLAHGLGPEARQAVDGLGAGEAGPLLSAMADIVTGRPPASPGALAASGCGGLHELWRRVGRAALLEPASDAADMPDAATRETLEAMHEPLRSRFAVALAADALRAGGLPAARVFRSVARRGDRAGRPLPPARRLLEARLARAEGDHTGARDLYLGLWAEGGTAGAEAMLALSEMALSGALPGAADTHLLRLDLGALALSERGTALGARALAAEAKLAARALGREAGLDLLAHGLADGTLDADAHAAAAAEIAEIAPGAEETTPLALLYARAPERYRGALAEPAFRAAVARSFAEIGLPERGAALLAPGDLADPALAAALAEGHLSWGAPREALTLAEGLPEGAERADLAARALAALGRPGEALARLEAAGIGTPARRARLAWAAEDWPAAAAALEAQAAEAPSPEVAARLEIAAARAGRPAPQAAPAAPPPSSAAEVAPYLERLRAETAAMKEVLADG